MLRSESMTPAVVRAMARYNRWMNEKVYASAALLGDEECKRDRIAEWRALSERGARLYDREVEVGRFDFVD